MCTQSIKVNLWPRAILHYYTQARRPLVVLQIASRETTTDGNRRMIWGEKIYQQKTSVLFCHRHCFILEVWIYSEQLLNLTWFSVGTSPLPIHPLSLSVALPHLLTSLFLSPSQQKKSCGFCILSVIYICVFVHIFRPVCFNFQRARAPKHFLLGKGHPMNNLFISTGALHWHQGNDKGHGGNCLRCLHEVSACIFRCFFYISQSQHV